MPPVSTPDETYRAFWLWWSVCAWLSAAVLVALAFLAARIWLVNPIVRAQRESAGSIVRAIEQRKP